MESGIWIYLLLLGLFVFVCVNFSTICHIMYLVAKWSFMIVTMGGIILFVGGIIVYILYNGISLLMFTLDFSHVTKVILWTITIIVIVGTLLFCLSKLSRGGGGYGDDPNY